MIGDHGPGMTLKNFRDMDEAIEDWKGEWYDCREYNTWLDQGWDGWTWRRQKIRGDKS